MPGLTKQTSVTMITTAARENNFEYKEKILAKKKNKSTRYCNKNEFSKQQQISLQLTIP